MSREVRHSYADPLDVIWLQTARAMGLTVQRSPDTYASTDGQGSLILSDAAGMDADDCIAQMVLHEICHSMVQGPASFGWVDWGLDNEGTIDTEREHACLRLQAALLTPYGLRVTLGPTTDFRAYYDALPEDPFEERSASERESIVRARAAYRRRNLRPWRDHLEAALNATAAVLHAAQPFAPRNGPTIISTLQPRPETHELGQMLHPRADLSCESCAWFFQDESTGRCRVSDDRPVPPATRACINHEEVFDCLGCGACCREAYDTVEVSEDDVALKLHLPLLVERSGGFDMARKGSRCICLQGGTELAPPRPAISGGKEPDDAGATLAPLTMPGGAPFTCDIYETRPSTCRDFSIFSDNCLWARRSVGLSR